VGKAIASAAAQRAKAESVPTTISNAWRLR